MSQGKVCRKWPLGIVGLRAHCAWQIFAVADRDRARQIFQEARRAGIQSTCRPIKLCCRHPNYHDANRQDTNCQDTREQWIIELLCTGAEALMLIQKVVLPSKQNPDNRIPDDQKAETRLWRKEKHEAVNELR